MIDKELWALVVRIAASLRMEPGEVVRLAEGHGTFWAGDWWATEAIQAGWQAADGGHW